MNIIPLIDVIFLLLAFFMFLTMSMVFQKGMPVDLAKAGTGESVKKEDPTVVISIEENGKVHWNKDSIDKGELDARLDRLRDAGSEDSPRVYVNAAESARHGEVIDIIDLIRKHDLETVIFAVEGSP